MTQAQTDLATVTTAVENIYEHAGPAVTFEGQALADLQEAPPDVASAITALQAAETHVAYMAFQAATAQQGATALAADLAPVTPPPPATLTLTAIPGQSATVGTVITAIKLASSGGTGTVTFAVTGLPAGLALSGSTISGTPTVAGTSTVTITATDSGSPQQKATETFEIVVAAAPSGTAGFGQPVMAPPVGTLGQYTETQKILDDTFSGTSLNPAVWSDVQGGPAPIGPWGPTTTAGGCVVNDGCTLSNEGVWGVLNTFNPTTEKNLFVWPTAGFYVQTLAKMSDMSHGFWPAIWFMSSTTTKGALPEIDIFEGGMVGGGLSGGNTDFESNYGGGSAEASAMGINFHQGFVNVGVDLTAEFHTYGFEFIPGVSATVYLDGKQVFQTLESNEGGIVGTGSTLYNFIINPQNGGSQGGWHTSGPGTGTIEVAEVQVYSLPTTPTPTPTPTTSTLWGVYNGSDQSSGSVVNGVPILNEKFKTDTGVPVSIARAYLDGGGSWASSYEYLAAGFAGTTGMRMNLCIPCPSPVGQAAGGASQFWAAAAAGDYNSDWQTMCEYFVSLGFGNAILCPWWEWDGTQNPSVPADATDYTNSAKAFNQFGSVARSVSADFHLSWYCGGNAYKGESWWSNCVPEAQYIDSVSIDFYDQNWGGWGSTGTPSGAGLTQAQHEYAWTNYQLPIINWVAGIAKGLGKPVGFGEWGIWSVGPTDGPPACNANYGGDDPYWIEDFLAWVKANNVYWASYFNVTNATIDPSSAAPLSAAALKAALG